MPNEKSVEERIRELEKEHAKSIREAQSQPGLPEMDIVYGFRKFNSPSDDQRRSAQKLLVR